VLIAAGAILEWAVTAHVSGIDLQTAGTVLFVLGTVGLILAVLTLQLTGPWQVSGAAAIMLPVARPAIGEAAALLS